MPSEIRHVVFRSVEVAKAVRSYFERTGKSVPPGELIGCEMQTDGPGSEVRFSMSIRAQGKPVILGVNGAELAAALILFCRAERIPLPATASKSLAVFGESLCLVVTNNPRGFAMPKPV